MNISAVIKSIASSRKEPAISDKKVGTASNFSPSPTCNVDNRGIFYLFVDKNAIFLTLGTFRSDYDYEYEYEFFNMYPVRMPDCVRLSRQLVLSSKSRRRLDTNYEIFNKSLPPTTSSLQVQRQVKRLVFKLNARIHCEMFRATCLAMFWRLCGVLCCSYTKHSRD